MDGSDGGGGSDIFPESGLSFCPLSKPGRRASTLIDSEAIQPRKALFCGCRLDAHMLNNRMYRLSSTLLDRCVSTQQRVLMTFHQRSRSQRQVNSECVLLTVREGIHSCRRAHTKKGGKNRTVMAPKKSPKKPTPKKATPKKATPKRPTPAKKSSPAPKRKAAPSPPPA